MSPLLNRALVLAAAGVVVSATASAAPVPAAPTKKRAFTAEVLYPVPARSQPRSNARIVHRLRGETKFSRSQQVLLVLGSKKDKRGDLWVKVQLPKRPNRSSGWVPEEAVQIASTPIRIEVSIRRRTVKILRRGRTVVTFRAAVGKSSTPTPTGLFAIADPVPSKGSLGPSILVLTAYSPVLKNFLGGDGVAAIHGWGDARVLGRAASNGCVRLSRSAVKRVARLAKSGTPVQIVK